MTLSDLASTGLALPILLITFGYFLTCVIWPFKACRTCHGTGKLRSPFIRALRLCPACQSTGLRLRAGRKAWYAMRRLHRANRRR